VKKRFLPLKVSRKAYALKRLWRRAGIILLLGCLLLDFFAPALAQAQTAPTGDDLPRPACGRNTDVFFFFGGAAGTWSFSTGGVGNMQLLWKDPDQTPLSDLRFGDFDGDGLTDVFSVSGTQWRYSSGGVQPWKNLRSSNVSLSDMAFGDFNGDGVTDVFNASGMQWRYSSAGTQPWQVLQSSNLLLNSLAFGNFDGDGVTDVFTVSGSHWLVSLAGNQPWQLLQAQNLMPLTLSELRFEDFDGDGKTDVFTSYSGIWYLSSGGTGVLERIGSSNLPLSDLRFGDFDGDGKTDVFSIGSGFWLYSSSGQSPWRSLSGTSGFHNNLTIDDLRFENFDAAGARRPFLAYTEGSDYGPQDDLVSADFNADGLLDLATIHSDLKSFTPFLNLTASGDALPSFGASANHPLQNTPSRLAVGDFNSDGRPDLAIVTYIHYYDSAGFLEVALNTTSSRANQLNFLLSPEFPLSTNPSSLLIDDFNLDGRDDLAYVTSYADSASILLNQTSAGGVDLEFSQPASFLVDEAPSGFVASDYNGDGLPDLATANSTGNSISLLLNQTTPESGTVRFARQVSLGTDRAPGSLIAADLDQDGRLDLALGNLVSSSVAVLFNATLPGASTAVFASPTHFHVGDPPIVLVAGDFNQDGLPDLVATQDTNNLSLLTNQTQPAALTMQGGSGQSARLGEPFPSPLGVRVSDACGNGLPGVQVAFSAPPSGPGAVLSQAVPVTGSDGLAGVSVVANNQAGSYTVAAAIPGTDAQLDFDLTNNGGRLYFPLIRAGPGPY
jgi:hypothetical protein